MYGYCFTLTDLIFSCPCSLLKTSPPPAGYPWVTEGLEDSWDWCPIIKSEDKCRKVEMRAEKVVKVE